MIGKTGKTNERQNRSHYFLWLRTLLGLCILGVIVVWVMNKGILLERLNAQILMLSTLISIVTSMLHAATLCSITSAYGRQLDYRYALYISALGTLGNTVGGLPLGTTLKYVILYKRVGLKIGQIVFGLTGYTAVISLALLGYATVSALSLDFRLDIKAIPGLLLIIGIITMIVLGGWAQKSKAISSLVNPFLRWPSFVTVTVLSFSLASLFILNSSAVGHALFPEHPLILVIFLSATGIFISLVSLLQSIAGIQEVTMGLSAFLSGIDPIDGVQIALVMRFASIIGSGMILGLSALIPGKSRPS
jgi:hypothetical protein